MPADDFVFDDLALPPTKSDRTGIPGGQDPNKWWAAADANYMRQIASNLRDGVVKAKYHGRAYQSSAPSPAPGVNKEYANASGDGHVVFPGGQDAKIYDTAGAYDPTARTTAATGI